MIKINKIFVAFCFLTLISFMMGCNNDQQQDTMAQDVDTKGVQIVQTDMPKAGEKIAVLTTNMGEIKVRLFPDLVPETYKNFAFHVEEGNYNGTTFHRVIEDFMIQGGDIEGLDGIGGYSYKGKGTTIAEEFDPALTHVRGALSMAKTMLPATTGSQFFIVQAEAGTSWLDNQHSVFGQVFEGMEVVDEIAGVTVGANDKPVTPVYLESVKIEDYQ